MCQINFFFFSFAPFPKGSPSDSDVCLFFILSFLFDIISVVDVFRTLDIHPYVSRPCKRKKEEEKTYPTPRPPKVHTVVVSSCQY